MPHEPSGSLPPVQQTACRRCPSCRRRSAAVARRHRQRTLRQVARRAEASYRALLAQHREGGGDAA
jgi:hypothetical protein